MDNRSAHSSSEYDALIGRTIPYYSTLHLETLKFVASLKPAPKTWLDTGCGTGNLIAKALDLFPTTEFYLSDPSAEMLEKARQKLVSERVTFLSPAQSQDLKPNSESFSSGFDVVTAIQCHHYLDRDQRRSAVLRCHQLLQPGGLLVTFENSRPSSNKSIEIAKKYWMAFQIQEGKTPADARSHIERFDKEYFPITISEHRELLMTSGFSVVDLFWYSYMQAGFYAIKAL